MPGTTEMEEEIPGTAEMEEEMGEMVEDLEEEDLEVGETTPLTIETDAQNLPKDGEVVMVGTETMDVGDTGREV